MNISIMYILIIILTILLFIITKNKIKTLKISGIVTISSSILLLVLILTLKLIISNTITKINISTITNYLFIKFIYTSLILFIIGLTEILISKYLTFRILKQKEIS